MHIRLLSLRANTSEVTNQGTKLELVESLELAASAGIKPVVEVGDPDCVNRSLLTWL